MPELDYIVENRVAWIRLNRPAQKNAFTLAMIDAWSARLGEAQGDPDVGAVVVTGNGDGFCAGVDLSVIEEMAQKPSALAWKSLLMDRVHKVALTLERMDKPVIAAVNGVAVGAGMDMALMCDMRFAARSARFSEGYIRIGAVPGDGGCYYLPRLVGTAKALELLLSGAFVDAPEALRIGLVNRVFEDTELIEGVREFAVGLASQSPVAVRMIKRAVYQSERCDLRTSLDLISSHMGIVQTTDDSREALEAFRQGRPSRFEGR